MPSKQPSKKRRRRYNKKKQDIANASGHLSRYQLFLLYASEHQYRLNQWLSSNKKKRINNKSEKNKFWDQEFSAFRHQYSQYYTTNDAETLTSDRIAFISTMGHAVAGMVSPDVVHELRRIIESYGPDGLVVGSTSTPISDENIGRLMLLRMGWKEGTGLGVESRKGNTEPVQVAKRAKSDKTCVGWSDHG